MRLARLVCLRRFAIIAPATSDDNDDDEIYVCRVLPLCFSLIRQVSRTVQGTIFGGNVQSLDGEVGRQRIEFQRCTDAAARKSLSVHVI